MIDFSFVYDLDDIPSPLPFKVFDAHTHTYPEAIADRAVVALGKFYDFAPQGKGTYADLIKSGSEAGYNGFLLFCVATNAHQVPHVNDSIAALTKDARARGFDCVGLAGMHQDFPDLEGELNRAISLGLQGVKLHPDIQGIDADAPIFMPLYEMMQDKDQILYFHAGDNRAQYRYSMPEKIAHVAKVFPRLRIVAAHLGGYSAWEEGRCLYDCDNVYYDCSSALWAMSPALGAEVIRACGVSRVMYGSDYPVMSPREHLRLFFSLPLTNEERKAILYDNAKAFLRF